MTRVTRQTQLQLAEQILRHSRFRDARRAHIQAFTDVFERDHIVTRLMVDAAGLMLASLLVGFYASHKDDTPETWATLGRVQKLVAAAGAASPRTLTDLIGRFKQNGYVKSVTIDSDRRIRIFKATESLLAHDRTYVGALHRSLHVLFPDAGYAPVVQQDANAHLAIRRAGFRSLSTATAFMSRHPLIMMFLSHDAGYLALLSVADTLLCGKDPEALSYTAIAARLGVSRTHIRNIFADVAKAGHISLSEAGGRIVTINASLWEAFDRFLADLDAGQHIVAQMAFAER